MFERYTERARRVIFFARKSRKGERNTKSTKGTKGARFSCFVSLVLFVFRSPFLLYAASNFGSVTIETEHLLSIGRGPTYP